MGEDGGGEVKKVASGRCQVGNEMRDVRNIMWDVRSAMEKSSDI